jgi:hypothetical protein
MPRPARGATATAERPAADAGLSPTPPDDAAPSGLEPDGAPASPDEGQVAPAVEPTPAEGPAEGDTTGEGAAAEGDEAEGDEEPKAKAPEWAALPPDKALEHEDFKPHVDALRRASYDEGRADNKRVQAFVQNELKTLQSLDGTLKSAVQSWNTAIRQAQRAGTLTAEEAAEIVSDPEHAEVFSTLRGVQQTLGYQSGVKALATSMLQDAGLDDADRDDMLGRLDDFFNGIEDPDLTSDLRKALSGSDVATARAKWEKEDAKLVADRVEAEHRAKLRATQPLPAAPNGTGGASQAPVKLTPADLRKMKPAEIVQNLKDPRWKAAYDRVLATAGQL